MSMRTLLIITSVALIVGAFPMPIGYYTFLRLLITVSAVLLIINEWKGEIDWTVIVFAILAIIFNPILPVYLHDKSAWMVIDIIAAVFFLVKSFSISPTKTIRS